MIDKKLYELDLYAWSIEQAEYLRQGLLDKLDLKNLAEEIEDVGEEKARSLESALRVLYLHILKWQYQRERRGKSWENSIKEHRRRVLELKEEVPSLKYRLNELAIKAYKKARYEASEETDLDISVFPECRDWDTWEILQENWLPEDIGK